MAPSVTIAVLAAAWLAMKRARVQAGALKASTVFCYTKTLRCWVVPVLGHREPASLTELEVEAYFEGVLGHKSLQTARMCAAVLNGMYALGIRRQVLTHNPVPGARGVLRGRRTVFRRPALRGDDLGRLLAELHRRRRTRPHAVFLEVLCATGVRPGEGAALRVEDVDFDAGRIAIRRTWSLADPESDLKTERSRRLVGMHAELATLLATWVDGRSGGDWLFPCREDPTRPMTCWAFAQAIRRARDRLRLTRPYSGHGCRHGVATTLLEAGHSVFEVADLLGHANVNVTTSIYGHEARANLTRLAETLRRGHPAERRPSIRIGGAVVRHLRIVPR